MCRLVTCRKCNKPTFAGCGAHVEQVLGHVPAPQRCRCREQKPAEPGAQASGKSAGPAQWWRFWAN